MKIKTTKKMNLHQLIEYITNNGLKTVSGDIMEYSSDYDNKVLVDYSGQISTYGKFFNDTFTVETEEELTEHTVLKEFHEYFWDLEDGVGVTEIITNDSISGILQEHDGETVPLSVTVRRTADNEPTIIWSKDTGIPTEGVIEV